MSTKTVQDLGLLIKFFLLLKLVLITMVLLKMLRLVDLAKRAGADCVKFQKELFHEFSPKQV